MHTNPSTTNQLHVNTDHFRQSGANNSFSHLPQAALGYQYHPNAQAARIPASPNLGVNAGRKGERSSSMVAHNPSAHVFLDDTAVASSNGSQPGNTTTVAAAPPSMPSESMADPVAPPSLVLSSLDAQHPRIFPGVVSKSRKSSVATSARPESVAFNEGYDQMMTAQSMTGISRLRSDEKSEVQSLGTDEDEVGEV